jgi:hypothetical protein
MGFRQSRRWTPLRAGICVVSGGIEGSGSWKISFYPLSMILRANILKSIIGRWVLGNLGDELHLEQESVEFQMKLKDVLAEKYSFILYQRYYELKSSIWIIRTLVLANFRDVLYLEQESVEFQEELKDLLTEKYPLIPYQWY